MLTKIESRGKYDFFTPQPKAKIVIFRHAQTVWNMPPKRIQGLSPSLEIVLSEKGKEAAAALLKKSSAPDVLICSPLLRCRQTAEGIFGTRFEDIAIPTVLMDGLREVNAGEFEGLRVDELSGESKKLWVLWKDDPLNFPGFPGGETLAMFQERVIKAFSEICSQYGDQEKEIYVISHGGPLSVLQCFLENKDLSHLWDHEVPNLARYELTTDQIRRLQQETIGQTPKLGV